MALTQTWYLQGTTATTIGATDYIQFSDGTFGNPITVGSFNGGTHVRSSGGTDSSSGNGPKNSKYLTSSTVDVGGGSVAVSSVSTANCPLKINVTYDSNITISGVKMYAYDGTTTTNAPTNLDVYLAEQGDSVWVNADGSASALTLNDHGTGATSHDFYVMISASPSAVGTQSSNKLRMEFIYQ